MCQHVTGSLPYDSVSHDEALVYTHGTLRIHMCLISQGQKRILSMGHASAQACIHTRTQVRSTDGDVLLGGEDIDALLVSHFAGVFR